MYLFVASAFLAVSAPSAVAPPPTGIVYLSCETTLADQSVKGSFALNEAEGTVRVDVAGIPSATAEADFQANSVAFAVPLGRSFKMNAVFAIDRTTLAVVTLIDANGRSVMPGHGQCELVNVQSRRF